MTIINKTTGSLKKLMAIKMVKASRTNGLKQAILKEVFKIAPKRELTYFEVLNALEAIERTKFYIVPKGKPICKRGFKAHAFREVKDADKTLTYKVEYNRMNMGELYLYIK